MADIKKELNDIKNAVYGKEVRGSIHDGIKKINDEVENATDLSESAKHQVENIQQQVNQLVVEGDSSVEAAQARVDAEGKSFPTLKARLDEKETQFSSQLAQIDENKAGILNESLLYTIGEGGDFNTLNEALTQLSRIKTSHINEGYDIELKFLSGYVVREQTFIRNIDLSYITLTSEDSEVFVDITGNIIRAINAKAPNINVLFNMDKKGSTGLHLERNSSIYVHRGCGVKNAGLHGIHFIESDGTILETIFTGAVGCGVRLTQSSTVTAMGTDASYAGLDGFYVSRTSSLHANEL